MVKLIIVMDFSGCTLSDLYVPAFDQRYEQDVSRFQQAMGPEGQLWGPTNVLFCVFVRLSGKSVCVFLARQLPKRFRL